MRVHVVDPAAYTPPYDRALTAALARRRASGAVDDGLRSRRRAQRTRRHGPELFYRWSHAHGRRARGGGGGGPFGWNAIARRTLALYAALRG